MPLLRRRRRTAPPPVVKVKVAPPRPKELEGIYSWISLDRGAVLRNALRWYNEHQHKLVLLSPPSPDEMKLLDKAQKLVLLGEGTSVLGEKEQAWRMALRQYERVWAAKFKLPTVDQAEAEGSTSRRVKQAMGVLESLNKFFGPHGLRISPLFGDGTRQYYEGEVSIPVSELSERSPLEAVLREIPTVAKAKSVVSESGESRLDAAKFFSTLDQLLGEASTWAERSPKEVLRRPPSSTAGASPRATAVPRAAGAGFRSKWSSAAVIRLTGKLPSYKGSHARRFSLIRDGMSISEFVEAQRQAGEHTDLWPIRDGVAKGLLLVEDPNPSPTPAT